MNAITARTDTEMDAAGANSSGQDKTSSSEMPTPQPSLFGEISSTILGNEESIAPSSATKAWSGQVFLSPKLMQSLISAGLVRGITPSSVRKRSGAVIPDFAFSWRDGSDASTEQKAD
jgi:hypothetical protein